MANFTTYSIRSSMYIAACVSLLAIALTDCSQKDRAPEVARKNSTSAENNAYVIVKQSNKTFSIHVDGNKLRDERGNAIHLHGVSIMGMEYTAVGGWSPNDPYPTLVESTWPALHAWNINVIRIPLNSISYLGLKCVTSFTGSAYGKPGAIQESDPSHNYKKKLEEVVDRATAEGLYVILDLHFSAPDDAKNAVNGISVQCPTDINPLPDADHSIEFWREIAITYKNYPNVMFDLFSDPYIDQWLYFKGNKIDAWKALRDGTEVNLYRPLWPTPEKHLWKSAGMQQLMDTIRNVGATNVILQGGISRSGDLKLWSTYKANDPLRQTAAAWHAFPSQDAKWGDKCYSHPGLWCDDRSYDYASNILAANYPVIVTEFGDKNAPGTVGAPFASSLLPHLDSMTISYLGWSFSETTQLEYQLVSDNYGTPSDGYGQYVKRHYTCLGQNTASCMDSKKVTQLDSQLPLSSTSQSHTHGRSIFVSPI